MDWQTQLICRSVPHGPGAVVTDVLKRLSAIDIPYQRYANAILYVGGNDASRGERHETFRENMRRVINTL